ncbi:hypothetical protein [Carboxylicivirga sp. RSCT41]|uniref:hypothetical protein n=1 Tax=Carboxylicivirga agarovorans TaxID=3417570 RepID=UPI003D3570E5
MNLKTKIGLGLLGAILVAFLFYYIGWNLAPGSYARAEIYELEISEEDLANVIVEFKNENPDLVLNNPVNIPNGPKYYLQDGRRDNTDHWYHIYFYYTDKDQIVKTWIRQKTNSTTQFAFVFLNDGLTLGKWTAVNEYFWWWKNRPIKTEFEERILKGIKKKIKERKPNNK